ncbi:uncharacterized protein TEOVI_000565200 [Trypanosoma equiperdum]|uniref:Uncharacterized protein n=1 Tax=Trypanosoma equiperdum TaxID=5694 RepID=A0A1G4I164_TRYEQ|nr:hypothetical protein, conserved [Trypanosoma equiperdum]
MSRFPHSNVGLVIGLVSLLLQLHRVMVITEAAAINSFAVILVNDRNSAALREAPTGTTMQIPPYVVRLSADWTVIENPQWNEVSSEENDSEGRLLHCRLPLPQDENTVQTQVKHYIQLQEHRTAVRIWHWLEGMMNRDGCIFGDGEGPITGVSEWYLFCVRGAVRKVNKTTVAVLYGNRTSQKLQQTVRRLVHRARWSSQGSERSKSFKRWTSRIGEYKANVTWPRWNVERQLWELIYPTRRECRAWEADAAAFGESPERYIRNESHRWSDSRSFTLPRNKEVWETVVRLYCQQNQGDRHVLDWSITEVLQTCTHEVLLRSPAVCEWSQVLQNFHVNPIPCIPI